MKIFKLILTFVIILGAVVGGFFLITDTGSDPLSPVDQNTYELYRKQFEEDWKQKGDWDEQLFLSHCDMVNQLSLDYNVGPLNDMNTSTAVEVVHDKIFAEWASTTCKYKTVEKYIKAIGVIEKNDKNASSNSLVVKIKDVNKVYRNAYSQAYQEISLTPSYNGLKWEGVDKKEKVWSSFAAYGNDIKDKRDNMLNNATYKTYLSNITDIKNRLNNLPDRISSARSSFYNSLATDIVDFYNAIPDSTRTRSQLTDLRTSRQNFEDEYSVNQKIDDCASQFNRDVNKNEEKAKLNESR